MSVSKMKSFPQTIYLNSHYQYYSWKMLQRKCQKKIFSLHSTNGKLKNNSKSYIYIYIHTHTHTKYYRVYFTTHTHTQQYKTHYCGRQGVLLRSLAVGSRTWDGSSCRPPDPPPQFTPSSCFPWVTPSQ